MTTIDQPELTFPSAPIEGMPDGFHYEPGRCPNVGRACNCPGYCRPRLVRDEAPAIAEAEAERDKAFDHLDASDGFDENALLREQILKLANTLPTFSANDMPQWVRDRTKANRRGRAFRAALDDGLIEVVGFVKSSNKATHGHRVLTYRAVAS